MSIGMQERKIKKGFSLDAGGLVVLIYERFAILQSNSLSFTCISCGVISPLLKAFLYADNFIRQISNLILFMVVVFKN
jgi:hypothetical protein